MHHFLVDGDVSFALHNLQEVVVGCGDHRQITRDAADAEREVFGPRWAGRARRRSRRGGEPRPFWTRGDNSDRVFLQPLGGEGRDFTVWRIDDDRSAPAGDDGGCTVSPELVIVPSKIRLGASVPAIAVDFVESPPLVLSGFLFCQKLFTGELRRALQRRESRGGPDSLKIWLTVGRPPRGPGLSHEARRRQQEEHRGHPSQPSMAHNGERP